MVREKFRLLKKAMQQTFRCLRQAAREERLPETALVAEFASQVGIMVSYAGFGDAAYPSLLAACHELTAARADADLPRLLTALMAIDRLQAQCHGRRDDPHHPHGKPI